MFRFGAFGARIGLSLRISVGRSSRSCDFVASSALLTGLMAAGTASPLPLAYDGLGSDGSLGVRIYGSVSGPDKEGVGGLGGGVLSGGGGAGGGSGGEGGVEK